MAQNTRPRLVGPQHQGPTLEAVRSPAGGFDVDAFHVMERRDEALIEQEILHGAGSRKFVYSFDLDGTKVSGISVIGARHLASHYGGIKHRIVASIQKTGALFVFTTYPSEGVPMSVHTALLYELEGEEDYYGVLVEVHDVKTGNAVQVERRESRFGRRRAGGQYEKPNYPTLAQSKAYRNGVLAIIPQTVSLQWKEQMLAIPENTDVITQSVIEEKRGAVLRYAVAKALPMDRHAIEELTMDQISGLGDAARDDNAAAFVNAARSVGLLLSEGDQETRQQLAQPNGPLQVNSDPQPAEQTTNEPKRRGRPPKAAQEKPREPEQAAAEAEQGNGAPASPEPPAEVSPKDNGEPGYPKSEPSPPGHPKSEPAPQPQQGQIRDLYE